MQKRGWDAYFERMSTEHPAWPLSALRRATNKYHAPYDQKAPPGHTTGGAVDVILVDRDNVPLDVISPTEGWEAAYTWSNMLSEEARANRMLMVEAMLGAGFSNCRDEYWHYSWGDSAWAVRVGEIECPFGWTHPPVTLETDFPQASSCNHAVRFDRQYDGSVTKAEASCAVPQNAEQIDSGHPSWSAGLYWARDVPVSFRLIWPGAPTDPVLYAGPTTEDLLPMEGVTWNGDALAFQITPTTDRVYFSNFPSPPKS
jgi:D-alanyl-D-alanine dipeptidase